MSDYYIAQTGQAALLNSALGSPAVVSTFNNLANWNATPGQSGKICPGDTVHLVGVISTPLIIQLSGSAGNIITILFSPGASMQAPVFSVSTGAISINGKNFITIDGGAVGTIGGYFGNVSLANGFICNTANGTAGVFANSTTSNLIRCSDSSHVTVKNLGLYNNYVRTSTRDSVPAAGSARDYSCMSFYQNSGGGMTNILVTNCLIHDGYAGIYSGYQPASQNFEFSFNTIYNCNWGANCGDSNNLSTLNQFLFHDNWVHDFANWDDSTGAGNFHHDGVYAWGEAQGLLTLYNIYNNYFGPNFGTQPPSGMIFASGGVFNVNAYNNVFICNPIDFCADGLIFFAPYTYTSAVYSAYNNSFIGGASGVGIDVSLASNSAVAWSNGSSYNSGNIVNINATGIWNCILTFTNSILSPALDVVHWATGYLPSTAQTYNLQNNLMTSVATAIALYNVTGINTYNVNYNCAFNLNPAQQYVYSTNTAGVDKNITQWHALGFDVNGPSGNPNLNTSNKLTPNSIAIGSGVNLTGVFITDSLGNMRRSVGNWDLGAYAFLPILPPAPHSTALADLTSTSRRR